MADTNDTTDGTRISRRSLLGSAVAVTLGGTAATGTATAHEKPIDWKTCSRVQINVSVEIAVFTYDYYSGGQWYSDWDTWKNVTHGETYRVGVENAVVKECWCFHNAADYHDSETKDYDYDYYRKNPSLMSCRSAIEDKSRCECHGGDHHHKKQNDDYEQHEHYGKRYKLKIKSTGGGVANYYCEVDGTVHRQLDEQDDEIYRDGKYDRFQGHVGPKRGVDIFVCTGDIIEFNLFGPANVFINGELVDPDELGY